MSLEYIAVIDLIVSVVLLILFLSAVFTQDNKLNYIKRNLPLIFSFIPFYFIGLFTGLVDYIFIIRLLNILKLISLYLFADKFTKEVLKYQEKTRLVYALAIFLLVLFICSFIFYEAEHLVNPQVINYEDSLWFVLQTITTVGYGDITPVTGVGRAMGVISMLSALVLTSIITSVATFSLIEKFKTGTEKLTERTKESVDMINMKLNEINDHLKEVDRSRDIDDIKTDLNDLKNEIDEIKDFILKNK
ncbi:MAG: potassium channel family protein [Methanobacterium sp.]|nr:potassium channel family protein [Methanobacterium sp.]